ncbi:hypothetical protein ABZP36_001742 [Zizania latifolia]
MVSILEVVGQQLCHVKGAAAAVASTVAETAKPGLATGLVFVKGVAADVASKTEGVGVGKAAAAVASTVAETAKPVLATGLVFVKGVAADVASKTEGVGVGKAAVLVGGAAVAAYFLWPAAVATAAGSATMSAPGAAGFVISRAAFLANPKLYFHLLRTVGYKAAVAAFAV